MAGEINKLIPQYGELNRIYNDWVINYAFSFDKQKFITDFYRQHNDTKAFEAAILELVLDKQKEQYTLILNSLKIEIEKNIRAYETKPLNDDIIKRVCFHYADRRNSIIKDQLEITTKLQTGRLSVKVHYNYTLRFRSCGLSRGAYGSALRTRQGLSALYNPTKE